MGILVAFFQPKLPKLHLVPTVQESIPFADEDAEAAPASPGVTIDEIFADDAVSVAYQPEPVPARSTASSSICLCLSCAADP